MKYETTEQLFESLGGAREAAYRLNYHLQYIQALMKGTMKMNERLAFRIIDKFPHVDLKDLKHLID